jgi:hypothetical protein
MGGGWGKQGGGIPMSERVRAGAEPRPPAGEVCPARHCWVADAADGQGVKRPGLLVEWRRRHGAWEGRVVYAVRLRPDSWQLVEEWAPASLLTPE